MDDAPTGPQDQPGQDATTKPAHLRRGGRARPELVGPGPTDHDRAGTGVGVEAGTEVEVEGVVEAGVEHGSVVLTGADGRSWQLGSSHRHLVGRTVTVRGRPLDLMTTAQQGVPLEVLSVDVAASGQG